MGGAAGTERGLPAGARGAIWTGGVVRAELFSGQVLEASAQLVIDHGLRGGGSRGVGESMATDGNPSQPMATDGNPC